MASLNITLPAGEGYKDLQTATAPSNGSVNSNDGDVFSLVNLVNKYLWFGLGVVAMIVIVIAGAKLITARGDDKEMKKVNQLIIGLVAGVMIAIFSYLLVRVIANVF